MLRWIYLNGIWLWLSSVLILNELFSLGSAVMSAFSDSPNKNHELLSPSSELPSEFIRTLAW